MPLTIFDRIDPDPGVDPSFQPHELVFRGEESEGFYDFDIKHSPDCPKIEWFYGQDHACGIAILLSNMGTDAFGVYEDPLATLAPGRYRLTLYLETSHHWEYGPEVNEWLEIGERLGDVE